MHDVKELKKENRKLKKKLKGGVVVYPPPVDDWGCCSTKCKLRGPWDNCGLNMARTKKYKNQIGEYSELMVPGVRCPSHNGFVINVPYPHKYRKPDNNKC
jgi:hypothetical protein